MNQNQSEPQVVQQDDDLYPQLLTWHTLARLNEANHLTQPSLLDSLKLNFPNTEKFKLISFGCGIDPRIEIDALTQFFDQHSVKFEYIGIGLNRKKAWTALENDYPHIRLIAGHGEDLKLLIEHGLENAAHIAYFGHPILSHLSWSTKTLEFRKMIAHSIPFVLQKGGAVICTTYAPEEIEEFEEIINQDAQHPRIIRAKDSFVFATENHLCFCEDTLVDYHGDATLLLQNDNTVRTATIVIGCEKCCYPLGFLGVITHYHQENC